MAADNYTSLPYPIQTSPQPLSPMYGSTPQWHIPVYTDPPRANAHDRDSAEEFPLHRTSQVPIGPTDERRGSDQSDDTLNGEPRDDPYKKYSLSSYEHPYDIVPPPNAYPGSNPGPSASQPQPIRSALRRSVSFAEKPFVQEYQPDEGQEDSKPFDPKKERELKRRGVLGNLIELYGINNSKNYADDDEERKMSRQTSQANSDYSEAEGFSSARSNMRRADSMASMMSMGSDMLDPDDPRVTGVQREYLEDREDVEKNMLRQMDYKARRKMRQRIRIEFNITCEFHLGLTALVFN